MVPPWAATLPFETTTGAAMKASRGILFTVLLGCALGAVAQTAFPNRPISLVVAFSAGGRTDSIARILAAPDGYLIGIGHIGTHVVNGAIYPLTYNLQTDLEPVAMIATNPQIMVGRNSIPASNLKELITWVKANQDKVREFSASCEPTSSIHS